ncbi:MAG: hypothetical protein HY902_15565 [Deltaproteobacteria bacterium]|nr:hypothetical protein [Deltaproteobacteria bacterium]
MALVARHAGEPPTHWVVARLPGATLVGWLLAALVTALLGGCGDGSSAQASKRCQVPADCGNPCTRSCVDHVCQAVAATSCDDGNPCTSDDCDKASGCTHLANAATCSDGDGCSDPDLCQGGHCTSGPPRTCDDQNPCTSDTCQAGTCGHSATGGPCSDGDACTLGEACAGGACSGGLLVSCDDGLTCTADSCDSKNGCSHTAGSGTCSDGDPCTNGDTCTAGQCAGQKVDCDDGQACTTDACGPTGCEHAPSTGPCSDDDVCTMADTCSAGACVGGATLPCGDSNPCTADSCDAASGCHHAAVQGPCDDGDACTAGTACAGGQCGGGVAVDCQDGNPCTQDSCDTDLGCAHAPTGGPCSDGNACTLGDLCSAGLCLPGAATVCGDENPCTADSCDAIVGCMNSPFAGPCSDGDACTQGDACASGACAAGPAVDCSDGATCTADTCNAAVGCQHAWLSGPCSDGNPCTTGEVCKLGACGSGAATDCSDGLACTADSCDPASGCSHAALPDAANLCSDGDPCSTDACSLTDGCIHTPASGAACSDSNPCTTGDTCQAGTCAGTGKLDCGDGNPCTADSCSASLGCQHSAAAGPCDDGNACTGSDVCAANQCQSGPAVTCNDGNPCTIDTCKPSTGCTSQVDPSVCDDQNVCTADNCSIGGGCNHAPQPGPCDDGDACTTGESCAAGACVSATGLLCGDGNPCTSDSCDPAKGCVFTPAAGSCSDGNPCTQSDACLDGSCKGGKAVNCDDSNACTTDVCSSGGGCQNVPLAGGKCGTSGVCLASGNCCTPDCTGKACGSDGCGGSCGGCAAGSTCTAGGTCVPSQCPGVSYQGCCDNNTLKYCENNTIYTFQCTNKACGWDPINKYYACTDGGADPSGQYPLACQSQCTPQASKGCCGQNLCWFDSCGNLGAVAQTCALGCDANQDACIADACQGIPEAGICLGDGKTVAACFKPSGGTPELVFTPCDNGAVCKVVAGKAQCVASGTCAPGSSTCDPKTADTRIDCSSDGVPVKSACPGCVDHDSGAVCSGLATATLNMTWRFQYTVVNASKTGWSSTPSAAPLAGALVVSRRPDGNGGSLTLGSAITDASGHVALPVPAQPQLGDEIAVLLVRLSNHGATVDFTVAEPDLSPGMRDPESVAWGDPSVFAWTLPASQWKDGGDWLLTVAQASAAAYAFDAVQKAAAAHAKTFGKPGMPLAIWMRPNVTWTCGACFWDGLTAHIGGTPIASSIWLPWESTGEEQWAIAVTDHELGHWVMQSWGASPGEGGTHFIGVPTFPGQAWSEGFATWHSSAMRNDPLYFDVQEGSSFWMNLASHATSFGDLFVPATASGGILQKMDENLVAAWLWELVKVGSGGLSTPELAPLWSALSSPRMTKAPYARGYTRHTWTTWYPGSFVNVVDTKEPVPMVADFLDALLCKGFAANLVQATVGLWPYDTGQPLCKVGSGP